MKMTLRVNGSARDVDVPPRTTLLTVLRDDLGLTGAKFGCGQGQCGACYVLADGRAVASCLLAADQAAGLEITTVEGLAQGDRLHPVQEAFIAEDAMQCGYCTSGMIMAAVAFLSANARPTEDAIVAAMDRNRNICRCGTYPRIVAAIKDASHA